MTSAATRPGFVPGEASQTAAETRAFLAQRGVDLAGEQQTTTRRALEFFSARLECARVLSVGDVS